MCTKSWDNNTITTNNAAATNTNTNNAAAAEDYGSLAMEPKNDRTDVPSKRHKTKKRKTTKRRSAPKQVLLLDELDGNYWTAKTPQPQPDSGGQQAMQDLHQKFSAMSSELESLRQLMDTKNDLHQKQLERLQHRFENTNGNLVHISEGVKNIEITSDGPNIEEIQEDQVHETVFNVLSPLTAAQDPPLSEMLVLPEEEGGAELVPERAGDSLAMQPCNDGMEAFPLFDCNGGGGGEDDLLSSLDVYLQGYGLVLPSEEDGHDFLNFLNVPLSPLLCDEGGEDGFLALLNAPPNPLPLLQEQEEGPMLDPRYFLNAEEEQALRSDTMAPQRDRTVIGSKRSFDDMLTFQQQEQQEEEEEEEGEERHHNTSRRARLINVQRTALKAWVTSHASNPFPNAEEKQVLARDNSCTSLQVTNWVSVCVGVGVGGASL